MLGVPCRLSEEKPFFDLFTFPINVISVSVDTVFSYLNGVTLPQWILNKYTELCMTISSVSNSALAQKYASQQKIEPGAEQVEKNRSDASSENNLSEKKFDDNVTLSQSERTNDSSKVIDKQAAEKILPRAMKSILTNSKMAISAQANTKPQAAQEFLTES